MPRDVRSQSTCTCRYYAAKEVTAPLTTWTSINRTIKTRYNEHANNEFNRYNVQIFGSPHVKIMLYAMRITSYSLELEEIFWGPLSIQYIEFSLHIFRRTVVVHVAGKTTEFSKAVIINC